MAKRVRVYMDIDVEGNEIGRMVFELYNDIAPLTCENFRLLCTSKYGFGYANSTFHRIVPNLMCQGGDITNHNGTGGRSIYGNRFNDETFEVKHDRPGILSMVNNGPNTNGSQFFITTSEIKRLDGRHVAFGCVREGMDVVKAIESYGTDSGRPLRIIRIKSCGQLDQN